MQPNQHPSSTMLFLLAMTLACSDSQGLKPTGRELHDGQEQPERTTPPNTPRPPTDPGSTPGESPSAKAPGKCAGPVPALHTHALALCGDLDNVGVVRIGSDERIADAAVNGSVWFSVDADIAGSIVAFERLTAVGDLRVGRDLSSAGGVTFLGDLAVRRDLSAGGPLKGSGTLTVGGSLLHGDAPEVLGAQTFGARGPFPGLAQPVDCTNLFDIASAVDAASANNDNRTAGLADALEVVGDQLVTLSSGRYYLEEGSAIGRIRFDVHGKVALYVRGDVALIGDQVFSLSEGATLDLFVSGSLMNVGAVRIASKNDASSVRIFVAGSEEVRISVGRGEFFGSLYAPRAHVVFVGDTRIDGAIFAESLSSTGSLEIFHRAPVFDEASECENEGPSGSGGQSSDQDGEVPSAPPSSVPPRLPDL